MKILILGWGSLIYDLDGLPVEGNWQTNGPILPIEFSRISQKGVRSGCLTLVVDPINGASVPTQFILSARHTLAEAIADLKKRERVLNENRIGFVNLLNGTMASWAMENHPEACQTVKAWAIANGVDAVVWTALTSNYQQVRGKPFSVSDALLYMQSLDGDIKKKATSYIRSAPETTETPLRREVSRSFR